MSAQLAHKSHWRTDGTCSYCGSISPEALFTAIAEGREIGPTDKNYKIYIDIADPLVGQMKVVSAVTFDLTPERVAAEGWIPADPAVLGPSGWRASNPDFKWMRLEPRKAVKNAKFYFQHLSEPEMHEFIRLFNEKKFNLAYPGRFYVYPFFMVRA